MKPTFNAVCDCPTYNDIPGQTSYFGYDLVDSVATMPFLGGNYNPNADGALMSSVLSVPKLLFGNNSPHSNYLCQGLLCAPGDQQPALEVYRRSPHYTPPTFIEPDGTRTQGQ